MGEWYDYEVTFKDKNARPSLLERLIADGYAEIKEHDNNTPHGADSKYVNLHIKKIDGIIKSGHADDEGYPERFLGRHYKKEEDAPFDDIHVGQCDGGSGVFYVNKWSPNVLIAKALSALYPEEILEVKELAPYYDRDKVAYFKGGDECNLSGEKLSGVIWAPNPRLIKENPDGSAVISLPIGDADDRWGRVSVPASDLSHVTYSSAVSGETHTYPNSVFFTKEAVEVVFSNRTVAMTPAELEEAYCESKNSYRAFANEEMVLERVPRENIFRRDEYSIVTVHVPTDVSENGRLTTTVQNPFVDFETGFVRLGPRKKEKTVQVMENGRLVRSRMLMEKIRDLYNSTPQVEADLEEDNEPDYD